jgi:phage/conjugal plasmid C-4 type zinc finger TraR family protein
MADECEVASDYQLSNEEFLIQSHHARMVAKSSRPSAKDCEDCGTEIPHERRQHVPGCTRCTDCETIVETERWRDWRTR